jgi:hypothetical protein
MESGEMPETFVAVVRNQLACARITIPATVAELLNLGPGDVVRVTIERVREANPEKEA